MSPSTPRRPSSSRTTTPRPRKIAGRVTAPGESTAAPDTSVQAPADTTTKAPHVTLRKKPRTEGADEAPARSASMFAGRRLTTTLLVCLAVIVLVLALQGTWFLVHHLRSDDVDAVKAGEIPVPAGRPITLNQSDVDAGVDQAAKDAVTVVRRNYKRYDDDVLKATDLMTTRFAAKFKQTAADAKSGSVKNKVVVDAKVLYQGAVRANSTEVQALLFLNQWVTKGSGKGRRVTLTPYRVLVTMVHTNTGWLVDDLDTK